MSEDSEIDYSKWELASTKKMVSFSLGHLILGGSAGFFSTIIFYYYEVEVGLPVILLSIGFMIFAVWNMVNDPILGYLTDKPFRWTKKYGMRFPWITASAIPMIICWVLLFLSPDASPSNVWIVFWYFVIISCLLDTFSSLFSLHLNASYTTHFRTEPERNKASLIINIVPRVLGMPLFFIIFIIVEYGNRASYILSAIICNIILVFVFILFIPGIRETEEMKERFIRGFENKERESFLKSMKLAFHQKSYKVSFFVSFFMTLGGILYTTSQIYFIKDILKLPLYYGIFMVLTGFIGIILFLPFWAIVLQKIGHVKTIEIGLFLIGVGYIPLLWMTTLIEAVFYAFLGGVFSGGFWIALGPVAADVNDEFTITNEVHQEGTLAGISTFFFRLCFIFQAIIFAFIHIITEYNPNPKADQTSLAIWGIRVHMGLIPSLLAFLSFLVMFVWYDLKGEKQLALKGKLKELGL